MQNFFTKKKRWLLKPHLAVQEPYAIRVSATWFWAWTNFIHNYSWIGHPISSTPFQWFKSGRVYHELLLDFPDLFLVCCSAQDFKGCICISIMLVSDNYISKHISYFLFHTSNPPNVIKLAYLKMIQKLFTHWVAYFVKLFIYLFIYLMYFEWQRGWIWSWYMASLHVQPNDPYSKIDQPTFQCANQVAQKFYIKNLHHPSFQRLNPLVNMDIITWRNI